jgi:protein TonB
LRSPPRWHSALPRRRRDDVVYAPGNGVSLPEAVKYVKPQYAPEAMRHKVKGRVVLEAVVKSDGTVGDVDVKQSLDKRYGQDDDCVAALKQWQFKPGMKDGHAVAVRVDVTMAFTMK